jgi:hypothetical protein
MRKIERMRGIAQHNNISCPGKALLVDPRNVHVRLLHRGSAAACSSAPVLRNENGFI